MLEVGINMAKHSTHTYIHVFYLECYTKNSISLFPNNESYKPKKFLTIYISPTS